MNFDDDFGFTAVDQIDTDLDDGYRDRLYKMYNLIEPLINNLLKDADKEMIKWPNRKEKLEYFLAQLQELLDK
jgi:hypothetical protein